MTKPFPTFETDEAAERFVAEADLTDYDWSDRKPVRFEFAPKGQGGARADAVSTAYRQGLGVRHNPDGECRGVTLNYNLE